MKRRNFLLLLTGQSATALFARSQLLAQAPMSQVDDPYAGVDWGRCQFVNSMSHQHGGMDEASLQSFYDMGYRHFALSNYYPSAPTYPMPPAFLAAHPDVIGAPNAEQHSFLDTGLHANTLGSQLKTGYGHMLQEQQMAACPLEVTFDNLNVFSDGDRRNGGIYRLDIALAKAAGAAGEQSTAKLTIDGATKCIFEEGFKATGEVRELSVPLGSKSLYLRAIEQTITAKLQYDNKNIAVTEFRLMQGTNRPWRDVFRAALDGEMVNGRREGGLQYADGGGITLNHPTRKLKDYQAALDFDPRVLGIEVWNVLTSGFGSGRGFYDKGPGPHLHFYNLWDDILRSGRRCLGFFVKDHVPAGRGRNVLILPDLTGLSLAEREQAALHAYRNGTFFGSVAAVATSAKDEAIMPFDHSEFRVTQLTLVRSAKGQPQSVAVTVAGNSHDKRPNIQIRFITDQGVASYAETAEAEFKLPTDATGRLLHKYVRIEAFAFPSTHNNGEKLSKEAFRALNVYEISLLHDKRATGGEKFFGKDQDFPARIPVVDMVFSQPLRFA